MDLQNVFYTVGIIFMVAALLILVGIAVLIFYVKKKIEEVHTSIENSIDSLTALSVKPVQRAVDIARSVLPPQKKTSKKL
ncbi:MAG: hypothetical protein ACR2LN_08070 [Candidatus Levyibacteriota bacterium]